MENLPVELYQGIFDCVTIEDLFNLRLVSKQMKNHVKNYPIKELIFMNKFNKLRYNWWFTNKTICYNGYAISKLSLLNVPFLNFQNLNYLKTNRFDLNDTISLRVINENCVNLKSLEISLYHCKKDEFYEISLLNLQVLFIDLEHEKIAKKIEINAPNLEALNLCYFQDGKYPFHKIKINHYLSIRYLKIVGIHLKNVSIFKNLNYLECPYTKQLNERILMNLPKLKELRTFNPTSTRQSLNNLIRIMSQKIITKRLDFQIYHNNLLISNPEDLFQSNSFDPIDSINIYSYLQDYSKLADNLSEQLNHLDYSILISLGRNPLPINFFNKFNCINQLQITDEVKEENHLIQFILQCSNLGHLFIKNSSLKQSFYNELPAISQLYHLQLLQSEELNLNFKFLKKMYYLQEFHTNQESISIKKLRLKKFKFLKIITFSINKNAVSIERIEQSKFRFIGHKNYLKEDLNLDQLFKTIGKYKIKSQIKNEWIFDRLRK